MSKVFFDTGVSLDGYVAGENGGPQNPFGDGGTKIHNWMYSQKAFWENMGMTGGEHDGPESQFIRDIFVRPGAYIMGKRMFEEGEPHWPEDLYKAQVYVLTNEQREPWVQKGSTTFHFINDGIEKALELAKKSANGKDVRIQGGANVIQQYLNAGYVDECIIHIAPILLGSGIRLFDNLDKTKIGLEVLGHIESGIATHIKYKITNK